MGKVLEVTINGNIGWEFSLDTLLTQLEGFKGKKIKVPINSYGGSVPEGLAIFNALKGRKEKIETSVIGYALSMGGVLLQAGSKRTMPKNSFIMLHRVKGGAFGNGDETSGMASAMLKMDEMIAQIYADNSNVTKDEVLEMMDGETWLPASEALELGFVDKLTEAAKFDGSYSKKMKETYLNTVAQFNNDPKIKEMGLKSLLNSMGITTEVKNDEEAKNLINEKISEAVNEKTEELNKEITNLKAKVSNTANDTKEVKKGGDTFEKRLNNMVSRQNDFEAKIETLEGQVTGFEAANTALKDDLASKEQALEAQNEKVGNLETEVETAKTATNELKEEKENLETKNSELSEANKTLAKATNSAPSGDLEEKSKEKNIINQKGLSEDEVFRMAFENANNK